MLRKRHLVTPALILGLLVIGAGIGIYTAGHYGAGSGPEHIEGLLWPAPKQIGGFSTVDDTGAEFDLDDLKGHWTFLFFGYTHCPDVCPVTLSVMDELQERMGREGVAANVQMVFVTVDPERDTTARLSEYVGYFNDDFTGLGGSASQVASLASQIGIAYQYGPPSANGDYLVDHTSSIFLLDPQARLVSIFSAPHDVETLLARFRQIEEFISSRN